MSTLPNCSKCQSPYTYEDEMFFICPECAHEWKKNPLEIAINDDMIITDSNGNILKNGDTITVIKDLKVKSSSLIIKVGTKIKNIRLVNGDHNIDCKIEGIGLMKLKSEFVKKM